MIFFRYSCFLHHLNRLPRNNKHMLKVALNTICQPNVYVFLLYRKCSSSNAYLAVVAIDFGTAYSGYAFSTTDMYKASSLRINVKKWKGEREYKTSTSVLLDEHKNLLKFGSEAQDEYARIRTGTSSDDYYYFENFKMMLYGSKVCLLIVRVFMPQIVPWWRVRTALSITNYWGIGECSHGSWRTKGGRLRQSCRLGVVMF